MLLGICMRRRLRTERPNIPSIIGWPAETHTPGQRPHPECSLREVGNVLLPLLVIWSGKMRRCKRSALSIFDDGIVPGKTIFSYLLPKSGVYFSGVYIKALEVNRSSIAVDWNFIRQIIRLNRLVAWSATRTDLASISSALASFWGGQLSVLVTKWTNFCSTRS